MILQLTMHKENPKIAVIGTGAIGGIAAGFIAMRGYDVEAVCKYQGLADKIRTEGLHIFGIKGDYKISMPSVAKISELNEIKDIVLLATKATDMLDAARELLPFLKAESLVLSMQNGICVDALAGILGRERTIGCVIGWGATMHSLGELEMTSKGEFVIGDIDHKPDERLPLLKEILSTIVPVRISHNIRGSLYSKLIINSCINSMGAISGLTLGEMLPKRKVRNIYNEIMREAMSVADAMNIKVERYAGILDYHWLLKKNGAFNNFIRHLLIRMMGFKYRRLKSSSLQSLQRGKETEIDYLNGYIADNGRKLNIPTPVNDKVIELIKDIEAGKRRISVDNLCHPFFAGF